jgi:hypothetical protein
VTAAEKLKLAGKFSLAAGALWLLLPAAFDGIANGEARLLLPWRIAYLRFHFEKFSHLAALWCGVAHFLFAAAIIAWAFTVGWVVNLGRFVIHGTGATVGLLLSALGFYLAAMAEKYFFAGFLAGLAAVAAAVAVIGFFTLGGVVPTDNGEIG